MNLPQPKDLPGSNCRITPRPTCPACPPSNVTHQLEEPAHTAYQSANLSFCGLLTSPSFSRFSKSKPCFFLFIIQIIFQLITLISPSVNHFLKPDEYGSRILPGNIISINLLNHFPSLSCAAQESPGSL
ncbi:hypothetical protein ATANTOWER_027137 [Ataeniobius toweri]|uniref:Uncharacterized protein n=1 Tax=Ataeniobius toweri TaxID=208326 RepID=A0ABU7AS40_9TELE|nr:hypothetical protein [Ataeniobius toweri]